MTRGICIRCREPFEPVNRHQRRCEPCLVASQPDPAREKRAHTSPASYLLGWIDPPMVERRVVSPKYLNDEELDRDELAQRNADLLRAQGLTEEIIAQVLAMDHAPWDLPTSVHVDEAPEQ